MICIRCGHCCLQFGVIIIDNPDLGIVEGNAIFKDSGEKCKHLTGDKPGKYRCQVHNKKWFAQTPCFDFGQIEKNNDSVCRIGEYRLRGMKWVTIK